MMMMMIHYCDYSTYWTPAGIYPKKRGPPPTVDWKFGCIVRNSAGGTFATTASHCVYDYSGPTRKNYCPCGLPFVSGHASPPRTHPRLLPFLRLHSTCSTRYHSIVVHCPSSLDLPPLVFCVILGAIIYITRMTTIIC